ncbi:hypothetical protein BDU57DRAFT_525069 [Ampelomyces quisqualis]|uniref:Uncharacterized protein n=1 Tax=Ampelomyces quisqualis TaxID=50730 RepID=A0A6A5Q632_AMPQU|nr:hypothetical protein BDU57DRAFT_525069 [Ampelomyces quisqualis]
MIPELETVRKPWIEGGLCSQRVRLLLLGLYIFVGALLLLALRDHDTPYILPNGCDTLDAFPKLKRLYLLRTRASSETPRHKLLDTVLNCRKPTSRFANDKREEESRSFVV